MGHHSTTHPSTDLIYSSAGNSQRDLHEGGNLIFRCSLSSAIVIDLYMFEVYPLIGGVIKRD